MAETGEYALDILPGGLRVVTVEMPHLHRVEMGCYVGVGSRYETVKEAGISHFLEHALFRGTEDYPTGVLLDEAFERIGGAANAWVDAEMTCVFSRLHPDCLDEAVSLFASLLRRPLLQQLDVEREIILEEALEDRNEQGEMICSVQLLAELCWPGHPLAFPVVGTPETIAALGREDLLRHHAVFYAPGNTLVTVVGRVQREAVLRAVERHFGDWPAGPPAPLPLPADSGGAKARSSWVKNPDSQVELRLGFVVPGRGTACGASLRLLRQLLVGGMTSRLMRRLREDLGLVYTVDAVVTQYADVGHFAVTAAVSPDKLVATLQETLDILAQLCRFEVGAEELEHAVRGLLFDLEFERDQAEDLAARYGWGLMAGDLKTIAMERREIAAETPSSLLQTARRFFTASNLRCVVVGPFQEKDRRRCEELLKSFAP